MTMQIRSRRHASVGVTSVLLAAFALSVAAPAVATADTHKTKNFVVTAESADLAREVAETAESFRKTLATAWLGHELPAWSQPCPIYVQVGPALGNGGATSFSFTDGKPFDWRMNVQGTRERLLDSAIPHEVLHVVLATHFGRPLPRWADEGAATTVEHASEKAKYRNNLRECLTTGRGIPLPKLLEMMEYPNDVLAMYSQSFSLVQFLIEQDGGRRAFIKYLQDGMDSGDWPAATKRHYGYDNLNELQVVWNAWLGDNYRCLAENTTTPGYPVTGAKHIPGPITPTPPTVSPYHVPGNVPYSASPGAGLYPTFRTVPVAQPPALRPTLPITDVIRLVEANVDDIVIMRHIDNRCLAAPLTTRDLIRLTKSGASVPVISSLQELPVVLGEQAKQPAAANRSARPTPADVQPPNESPAPPSPHSAEHKSRY